MNISKKLERIANSVLNSKRYKNRLEEVFVSIGISCEEIVQKYIEYDMNIGSYDNEVYNSLPFRAALYLHYLLPRSWHQIRQQEVLRIIKKVTPRNLVDVGFGAPTRYIEEYVLKEQDIKATLVDKYDSAFSFARTILDSISPSWRENIMFKKIDMNHHILIGDYDFYIFQDSIEHVQDATNYLRKTVDVTPNNSYFLLSLPLGPSIPSHTICWEKEKDALRWLRDSKLTVLEKRIIKPNPCVDLFAQFLPSNICDLVVC